MWTCVYYIDLFHVPAQLLMESFSAEANRERRVYGLLVNAKLALYCKTHIHTSNTEVVTILKVVVQSLAFNHLTDITDV